MTTKVNPIMTLNIENLVGFIFLICFGRFIWTRKNIYYPNQGFFIEFVINFLSHKFGALSRSMYINLDKGLINEYSTKVVNKEALGNNQILQENADGFKGILLGIVVLAILPCFLMYFSNLYLLAITAFMIIAGFTNDKAIG